MVLISYSDDPSMQKMAAKSIRFREKLFLHGSNTTDTICIIFSQIQSPNWEIVNPAPRNIVVTRSGAHSFPDALQFKLRAGRQPVPGEVIPVYSECYLLSSKTHRIHTSMTVTV